MEIWSGGRPVPAGQPRQRILLAALLIDAGRPVAPDTLLDRVWGAETPDGARHALHTYVARIRALLGQVCNGEEPAHLTLRSGGYVLEVAPERVDLHRFRRLVAQARDPQCSDTDRVDLLREALGLWRGEALAGLSGAWAARIREGCRGERLDAAVLSAQAELRLGDPAEVIGPLRDLAAEYPMAEPLTAVLMRSLHATGRTAEALETYRNFRRRLVEELGTEPAAELQAVHQAILRGEPDASPAARSTTIRAIPTLLPMAVPGFAGRGDALTRLDGMAARADQQPGPLVISVSGSAGVGKTALAVQWAHRVAHRFPDGQLYLNLRGFDPSGAAVTPIEAVRLFLDALGVPPQRIPTGGLEAQVGLYRSLLAGHRVLVVLDNARDADQVRPLLPTSPSVLVLVTSRSQLPGLVATEGAHPLTLDLLTREEARELLSRRLGEDRTGAEPEAIDQIIGRCARLPLALTMVAARAAINPGFPLAILADELSDSPGGLDVFAGGDDSTDVRAVFSWSYRTLSEDAARLFRLLALHPEPEIGVPAAASLAGIPRTRARQLLGELTRAHLMAEPTPGRFSFHDLLRAYATELNRAVEAESERTEALHRLLDHYLNTATTADHLLDPHVDQITLEPARPGVLPEELGSPAQAMAWFTMEHPVLVGAVRRAEEARFDTHTWQLAWTLTTFFHRRGHWQDWAFTQTAALAAARRRGDRPGQAYAHRDLGRACARLGQYGDSLHHYRLALDLFEELGDNNGKANAHQGLSWMFERQGNNEEALRNAEHALSLYQAAGQRAGEARALNAVGWYHAQLGGYLQARDYCQRALDLHREIGDRSGEANTLDSLGYALHHLGDHAGAIVCYEQALVLYHDLGDRYDEALTFVHLGDTQTASGEPAAARAAWEEALKILTDLSHPDAATIREKLAQRAAT